MKSKYNILGSKVVCMIIVVVFFCNSACSGLEGRAQAPKEIINSNSDKNKECGQEMSSQVLVESLINIDPKLFSSREALKEAVSLELPMGREEGIALRVLTPIDIAEQHDTLLVVLIGVSSETISSTPLAENARIVWVNKDTNIASEVRLFQPPAHKIPMPADDMPPHPVNPVLPKHMYSVEVVNVREKLNIEWVPSKYTIQVVVGEMFSNVVDFELVANGS